MSRIAVRAAWRRPRHLQSRLGVLLAFLALSFRLMWVAPPPSISSKIADFAALGEHALCLANPANIAPASVPRDTDPAQPGDHADHDHSLCCLWHASTGFVLPQIVSAARITFVKTTPALAAAVEFHPADLTAANRARGPPGQA